MALLIYDNVQTGDVRPKPNGRLAGFHPVSAIDLVFASLLLQLQTERQQRRLLISIHYEADYCGR